MELDLKQLVGTPPTAHHGPRQATRSVSTPHWTRGRAAAILPNMSDDQFNPPSAQALGREFEIETIARALIVSRGHVLLCRNLKPGPRGGHAFLPGGHVEFGEAAQVALRRELREEAGVEMTVGRCVLVGETSFTQSGRRRHEVNLVFHGELAVSAPAPIASLEPHIGFEWFPVERLADAGFKPDWMVPFIRQLGRAAAFAGPTGAGDLETGAAIWPSPTTSHPVWVSFMESPISP
ncbi:MAG: NUDIX domain-containing protein [Phycisphaerales bacterium]